MVIRNIAELNLRHFTGSENWYRHGLVRDILFTDGVKYVADTVGAYWLLDEIAFAQRRETRLRFERFQVWTLTVADGQQRGVIRCEDGNGIAILRKDIQFTDFPWGEFVLWFTDKTILLPSEY